MEITEKRFADLGLSEGLLKSLEKQGYIHPTPIQEKAIPIGMSQKDLIGCAQTGTGKTLAFVVPLIEHLKGTQGTQAVILCPTREIAMQTHEAIEKVGGPLKIHSVSIIGGRRMQGQIQALRQGVQILVATPGRLVDHMERRNVNLSHIRYLVLDEADHMLDLGFLPQMRKILRAVPEKRQTMMFSATFPHEISQLASQYLKNPERVEVVPPGTTAEGVEHTLYLLEPQDKRQAILNLLEQEKRYTLIFTRTRLDAEWLSRLLATQGHAVDALHADRSQGERIQILDKFKKKEFQMLVATDIMARGIDVKGIDHVVNYDIPQTPEDYVHRIGRTARLHATGHASTLASWVEMHFVEAIEKQIGFPLPRKSLTGIKAFDDSAKVKPQPLGKVGRRGPRVRMR